jgi:zinc transport system permease protein
MEILSYSFFQNALICSLLASILCAIVGTYIVTRRLVFISGGITHASFGGVGLGVFFGLSPVLGAALFSVGSALGVQWLSHRREMREDSAIAVFWTFGMSVGIIFSFLSPGFVPELSTYLFGNILVITHADLVLLAVLTVVVALLFSIFLRPIVAVAFDAEFARSQRLPVKTIEYLMMALIALTIVACLRLVGIVLVISLLTIPQMTANLFTYSFKRMIFLSIIIGFADCLCGLTFAYLLNIPSGASIIFASITLYLICKLLTVIIKQRKRQ